jgi:AbrB family looped-hinge helix DNA binding protein
VTIPAPVRKKYGLKGGSKVAFEVTPSGAFLLRCPAGKSQ